MNERRGGLKDLVDILFVAPFRAVPYVGTGKNSEKKEILDTKKTGLAVGLLQGVLFLILFAVWFAVKVMPTIGFIGEEGHKAVENTIFTRMQFNNGIMNTDSKPSIATYYLYNTDEKVIVVALDSIGKLNKAFYNDRILHDDVIQKAYGVQISPQFVRVKGISFDVSIPWTYIVGKKETTFSKSDILEKINFYSSWKYWIWILIIISPLIFGIGLGLGMLLQRLFIWFFVHLGKVLVNVHDDIMKAQVQIGYISFVYALFAGGIVRIHFIMPFTIYLMNMALIGLLFGCGFKAIAAAKQYSELNISKDNG